MAALPLTRDDCQPALTGAGASRRVLVADGNPSVRLLAATILRRAGYAVDTAETGLAALRATMQGGYAAVLVGASMPGVDCDEIVRRAGAGKAAVIGLVAPNRPEERTLCRSAGMHDCVEKPLDAGILLGRIVRHTRLAQVAAA